MKKKIKIILIALLAIFIFAISYYLDDRFSYAKKLPYYPVTVDNDTILTIGIIGDSWVAGKNLDSLLHEKLIEKGINNKIISSGHSGAKSKLIYQNMFKDSSDENSSKFLLKNHPDYCIVIAGVNDAQGQVGAKFYSHHVTMIIKTLLHYRIKPVIVELPEFGIIKAINDMNFINKNRNIISAKINNKGEINNIKTYRKELNDLLKKQRLTDKIIFVDFDNVCSDFNFCKEIYTNDGVHLNKEGKKLFTKIIVDELVKITTL